MFNWSADNETVFRKALDLEKELNHQDIVIPFSAWLYNLGIYMHPARPLQQSRVDETALPGTGPNQHRHIFLTERVALVEKLLKANSPLPTDKWSAANEVLLDQVLKLQGRLNAPNNIVHPPDMATREKADYDAPDGVDLNVHRSKYLLEELKKLQDLEKRWDRKNPEEKPEDKPEDRPEEKPDSKEKVYMRNLWSPENSDLLKQGEDLEKEVLALGIDIPYLEKLFLGRVDNTMQPGVDMNVQRKLYLEDRIHKLRRMITNHNPNSWSRENKDLLRSLQTYMIPL
ncbi:uncharacterized protein PAC_09810 [Phialocephala subalpina]|uniref:Uncharacterized protein n=1 Tax=Phialocephala subalpina TaxID=576137 RepID=A0A1L7X4H2_9HELO|nr:uncharacterized protein PAC_09810 [Phialocephala subalpina]